MPATPRIFVRAIVAVLIAAGLTGIGTAASAHAALVSSSPNGGDVLDALPTVRLEFTEALLDIGNAITVTDVTGATTNLELTYPKPEVVEASVPALPPGVVTIAFRVVAADGHDLQGTIAVTLKGGPSPSSSASSTTSSQPTTTPVATPSATPGDLGSVSAGEEEESHGPLALALLGLLAVGAAATFVVARRGRPGSSQR